MAGPVVVILAVIPEEYKRYIYNKFKILIFIKYLLFQNILEKNIFFQFLSFV